MGSVAGIVWEGENYPLWTIDIAPSPSPQVAGEGERAKEK